MQQEFNFKTMVTERDPATGAFFGSITVTRSGRSGNFDRPGVRARARVARARVFKERAIKVYHHAEEVAGIIAQNGGEVTMKVLADAMNMLGYRNSLGREWTGQTIQRACQAGIEHLGGKHAA